MISYAINPTVSSAELNHLFALSWPDHKLTNFDELLTHAHIYICAYHDSELIGFAKLISDSGVHGFLLDPTVAPKFRRQGHAQEMIRQILARAKSLSIEWVHVDYEPRLRSFYTACGFAPTEAGLYQVR